VTQALQAELLAPEPKSHSSRQHRIAHQNSGEALRGRGSLSGSGSIFETAFFGAARVECVAFFAAALVVWLAFFVWLAFLRAQ
jgi:hypothetical protein